MADLWAVPFHVCEICRCSRCVWDGWKFGVWHCKRAWSKVVKTNGLPYMNVQLKNSINVRIMFTRRKYSRLSNRQTWEAYREWTIKVLRKQSKRKYPINKCGGKSTKTKDFLENCKTINITQKTRQWIRYCYGRKWWCDEWTNPCVIHWTSTAHP